MMMYIKAMYKKAVMLLMLAVLVACNQTAFQKKADGIVVKLNKETTNATHLVRPQVMNDNIIRVSVS